MDSSIVSTRPLRGFGVVYWYIRSVCCYLLYRLVIRFVDLSEWCQTENWVGMRRPRGVERNARVIIDVMTQTHCGNYHPFHPPVARYSRGGDAVGLKVNTYLAVEIGVLVSGYRIHWGSLAESLVLSLSGWLGFAPAMVLFDCRGSFTSFPPPACLHHVPADVATPAITLSMDPKFLNYGDVNNI